MILLIAALFLAGCLGQAPIASPDNSRVKMMLHQSGLFQIKCESLLYRSVVMDDLCYFAIDSRVAYSSGPAYCDSVFPGATFHTARNVGTALSLLLLNSGDYHGQTTMGSERKVLCKYENPFTCASDERRELPGRCLKKADRPMAHKLAVPYCQERGSSLPFMLNSKENDAITAIVASSSTSSSTAPIDSAYWTIVSVLIDGKFSFSSATQQRSLAYSNWHFGSGAPKCKMSTAFAVSTARKGACASYSTWELVNVQESRQVVCVRPSDSAFNPPKNETKPAAAAPKPAEPLPVIEQPKPAPVVVVAPKVYPKNDRPNPAWMWTLSYYYNWGRILHGFCADPVGCNQMFSNGIGYDRSNGAGPLGKTITNEGMTKMPEVCSENYGKLKPLYFRLNGVGYLYNFDRQGIYVGWVAVAAGHCGANVPIRVWSCALSADAMYAVNLDGNTWYRGRAWGGGPRFWLWS